MDVALDLQRLLAKQMIAAFNDVVWVVLVPATRVEGFFAL